MAGERLDAVLKKIKNRKAAGLNKIPFEVWKTRKFDDIHLRLYKVAFLFLKKATLESLRTTEA